MPPELQSDDQSPPAPAWVRLLDGVDWRLVGMTALFGAMMGLDGFQYLLEGRLERVLQAVLEMELNGFMVLLLAAILFRWRALPRPIALAFAVIVGCLASRAITIAPHVGNFGAGFPGGEPSHWTLVWFFGRQSMMYWGILATAWYFLQRATERQAALRESSLARHVLETQLVEARLQVMQAQVEPHFLFNTLAHVKRLYKTDPLLGERMLGCFCEYLHAALPQMREAAATLGTELALARAYLDVQKIRMGDRLVVDFAVPEEQQQRPFPPMMLASLVENAIKHGLNPLAEGGIVRVFTESSPEALRVIVADTGRGFAASRGTGVGLANIRGRLAALYGSAARFTLAPNVPRGMRATIEIATAPVAGNVGAD